jgi:uncharacterized coiled-coil protein SlyX
VSSKPSDQYSSPRDGDASTVPKPALQTTVTNAGQFQQINVNGTEFWVATRYTIQQLISQQNQQANKITELSAKLARIQSTVDQQALAIQRLNTALNSKVSYD